jgi:hypothetical protein
VFVPVANAVSPSSDPESFAVRFALVDGQSEVAACVYIPMSGCDMPLSNSQVGPVCLLVGCCADLGRSAADLVLSGAYTRPHQRIWPEIALDVGRDNLSRDAIAWHKPLICARHGDYEVCRRARKRKTGLMSVPGKGQGERGAKRDKEGCSRLQDKTPEAEASARREMNRSCSV